jgi:hypothetical protein
MTSPAGFPHPPELVVPVGQSIGMGGAASAATMYLPGQLYTPLSFNLHVYQVYLVRQR